MNKKILFLTGTRADFGKLKSLMLAVDKHKDFDCFVFVTGMHMLSKYGNTADEVLKAGFHNIHPFMNHTHGEPMDLILANTINGLSRYVQENKPDMIIVHGDRVEALAGAIVGSLNNILVGHIEGGEVSGTIDELIRHATSKLSHVHFVSNKTAAKRLRQLGEHEQSIYVIGSPDIDVMLSRNLPSLKEVKKYYEIPFKKYAIAVFHPVTTELKKFRVYVQDFVAALIDCGDDYVVIYPNNDQGCEEIVLAYEKLKGNSRFRMIPSMRFEYFLTLLKKASYLIGNSSSGICESPVYAVPSVNVGNRQLNRFKHRLIVDVGYSRGEILFAIARALELPTFHSCRHFGEGKSVLSFMETIKGDKVWKISKQKQFCDIHETALRKDR